MQVEDPVRRRGRRGATTEAYGAIRRKKERSKATQPFDVAQGHELVEWQMMP